MSQPQDIRGPEATDLRQTAFEQTAFKQTAERIISGSRSGGGIGTLGEKTLHTVLKYYLEPDSAWHEVKVGPYVVDILGKSGIIEIQTRNFSNMRKKLEYLLADNRVTIVYPAVRQKWLSWIDPNTGEITKKRKSPKTGTPSAIFHELGRIKPLLKNPNLSLRVLLLDMEETRFLNGWSDDKKRGSHRCNRIPTKLAEDIDIRSVADYAKLLPPLLPTPFTSKDYQKAASISLRAAQTAINVLQYVGVVAHVGKQGRLFLYAVQ